MRHKGRGWAIIAVDLIIILGVYFVFMHYRSQFVDSGPSYTESAVEVQHEGVEYRFETHRPSEDRLQFIFSIANSGNAAKTIEFPQGLNYFFTDQDDYHRRLPDPLDSQQLQLSPGEKRVWSKDYLYPREAPTPLYGAFYIDDNREGMVLIP